ncbi:MAG: malto-oligosyltrehalose trehalohydrolase [Verrucomicrobiota bacterium]
MQPGATYLGDGRARFTLWAPERKNVAVRLLGPAERLIPMECRDHGWWWVEVDGVAAGERYQLVIDGDKHRPDPASQSQPDGPHEPSMLVDQCAFRWSPAEAKWAGLELKDAVIYEIHVGSFTPEGTFDAIIPRLASLQELGVNCLELMPVAHFPGERNWGYDGVFPYAPHAAYGGVQGLKRLVDAAHVAGIAVILDVVYNHLGPEGNYLWELGSYFTDRYKTPWGPAVNFDGAHSDGVRAFFVENALYWLRDYRLDGLRLDAVHSIYSVHVRHLLAEIEEAVNGLIDDSGRSKFLVAETDLNEPLIITSQEGGGYGLDGQWCDEFHHALHHLLTGETNSYYRDFGPEALPEFTGAEDGKIPPLIALMAKSLRQAYVYDGQYMLSRQRKHGESPEAHPGSQFCVFSQNHDHIGNRMRGERLLTLTNFEAAKLAAGTVLMAPFVPLLFMGEEYGEEAPFLYFINHSDRALLEGVRKGRKKEFKEFYRGKAEMRDPGAVETFEKSKLHWESRSEGRHAQMLRFYRECLQVRRETPLFSRLDEVFPRHKEFGYGTHPDTGETMRALWLEVDLDGERSLAVSNFEAEQPARMEVPAGTWQLQVDSYDASYGGPGNTLPQALNAGESSVTVAPLQFGFYRA